MHKFSRLGRNALTFDFSVALDNYFLIKTIKPLFLDLKWLIWNAERFLRKSNCNFRITLQLCFRFSALPNSSCLKESLTMSSKKGGKNKKLPTHCVFCKVILALKITLFFKSIENEFLPQTFIFNRYIFETLCHRP